MIYIMNRIYDERELDLSSKRYHHGVGSRAVNGVYAVSSSWLVVYII
jgi:hypothetical protein